MLTLLNINPVKTYKTRENAIKAAEKKLSNADCRYTVLIHTDGRFFPVFLGQQALTFGAHFHFNVIG